MFLIALDFWSIVVYFFLVGMLLVSYRLILQLGRFTEGLIISIAQMGMVRMARALLITLVGYNQHTYRQPRFILWNQVYVRFALLWGSAFLLAGIILLFKVPQLVWIPTLLALIVYRLVNMWTNPARPPIYPREPSLKQYIQDVNEPMRTPRRSVESMIRRWDYLDELFAESA